MYIYIDHYLTYIYSEKALFGTGDLNRTAQATPCFAHLWSQAKGGINVTKDGHKLLNKQTSHHSFPPLNPKTYFSNTQLCAIAGHKILSGLQINCTFQIIHREIFRVSFSLLEEL